MGWGEGGEEPRERTRRALTKATQEEENSNRREERARALVVRPLCEAEQARQCKNNLRHANSKEGQDLMYPANRDSPLGAWGLSRRSHCLLMTSTA